MIPFRRSLPHEIPSWVDPSNERYFITVCCQSRGKNQLANAEIGQRLFETIRHRNASGICYVSIALLMPDHIHLLVSFPQSEKRIRTVMSKWKEWTAKSLRVCWQRDFFEHRLRHDESFSDEADYILDNPVRAGLVKNCEDWPYVFIADSW